MANQLTPHLKSLAIHTIPANMKTHSRLAFIFGASLLFAGVAHAQGPCPAGQSPCVLVSDDGQVKVWSDNGTTELNSSLLDTSGGGGGGGEGVACLAGSKNVLYVANNSSYIDVYGMTLNGSGKLPFLNKVNAGGSVAGLAPNGTGTLLYAAEGNAIGSLTPLSSFPWLSLNAGQTTPDSYSHDVALGVCATGVSCAYGGNVVTDLFQAGNTGIGEYMPNPNLNANLPFLGQFMPGIPVSNNSNCAKFSGVTHCWSYLAGMVFDSSGNLWVNSDAPSDAGTFEFAPGGSCGAPVCPLNFTPDHAGVNALPIGITIAPATDPVNPGKILLANYSGSSVDIIDPQSCTGHVVPGGTWTLGTCTGKQFISDIGNPKYVVYNQGCPNPDNNGYVEICKGSNPNYPVTGTFDFTVTAPMFSSGTIAVPVGECSGSILVPSAIPKGTVTITETPTVGDLVSNVTAYSYDNLGFYTNELQSWTQPDLYANVNVVPGDVSLETEAIFTNYAAQSGQLKICKIAGQDSIVGKLFTFVVTAPRDYRQIYTIEAGPADQGGYCTLAGTFPPNTPVTVTESLSPTSPYSVAIQVACNACTYSFPTKVSVATTIGAGITQTNFTNSLSGGTRRLP